MTKTLVGLVAAAGASALLTVGYIVFVGRAVGPEEYGDFAAALALIYFVGVAVSPLTPAIGRLVARYAALGEHDAISGLRRAVMLRAGAVAATVAIAGAALSPVFARFLNFRTPVSLALAFLAVALFMAVSVDRGFLHGLQRFGSHNVNTLLEASLRVAGALILLPLWRSAAAALVAYVIALAAAEAAMLIAFRGRAAAANGKPVDWGAFREITLPMSVLMFALAAFQNADMLVVKRFFATAESGSYGAATALARGIGVIFVPFFVMIGPALTALHAAGKSLIAPTLRLTAGFVALSLLAVVPLQLWATPIVQLLYGSGFRTASAILAPLAGVAVITYTGLMLAQALLTARRLGFLWLYAAAGIAQVLALWMFHASFRQVLVALYSVQGAVLLVVAIVFFAELRSAHGR